MRFDKVNLRENNMSGVITNIVNGKYGFVKTKNGISYFFFWKDCVTSINNFRIGTKVSFQLYFNKIRGEQNATNLIKSEMNVTDLPQSLTVGDLQEYLSQFSKNTLISFFDENEINLQLDHCTLDLGDGEDNTQVFDESEVSINDRLNKANVISFFVSPKD